MYRSRTIASALGAAALALALTSCAGTAAPEAAEDETAAPDPSSVNIELLPKDEEIAALVPQAIRDKGVLTIATDATAPPNQFFAEDGKTIIGNEVDFADQIGSILGLEVEWVNVSFDSIIPGLEAGRYDLAMTGMRDTKEREEVVDFVTYAKAGPQLFTQAGNPNGIEDPKDLCGHSIAMQSGTLQLDTVEEISEKCVEQGKDPIDISTFKTQAEQIQAVASGRAEYGAQNAPNNAYLAVQTDGALVGVGDAFAEGPWGMPVPKGTGLLEPLHLATQKLIESDTYDAILKKWGVETQGIDEAVINGATS